MTNSVLKKNLCVKGTVTVMPETNKKVKRDVTLIFSRGFNGFTWLKWNIVNDYRQILIEVKKHVKKTGKPFTMSIDKPFDAYRDLLIEQGIGKNKAFEEVLEIKKRFHEVDKMHLHTNTGKAKFNDVSEHFSDAEIEQIFSEISKT